jgi:hypothetical protein
MMPRKKRIYLDTSVMSHLDAPDAPVLMQSTIKLWKKITAGKYEVFISRLTYTEMDDCPEPKRSYMLTAILNIPSDCIKSLFTDEIVSPEAKHLSNLYLATGGFTLPNITDAQHVAIATINNCDIILSWNLKHMVHPRAIQCVEAVNAQEHYKKVSILTPFNMLMKEREHEI